MLAVGYSSYLKSSALLPLSRKVNEKPNAMGKRKNKKSFLVWFSGVIFLFHIHTCETSCLVQTSSVWAPGFMQEGSMILSRNSLVSGFSSVI